MPRYASALVSILAAPALGWWDDGHMLTARIAQEELQANHPDVWAQVNTVIDNMQTKYEDEHIFVEAATFPDKFKWKGYKKLGKESPVTTKGPWHFVNTPFWNGVPEKQVKQDDWNVVHAIKALTTELEKNGNTELAAYQLRCLIHYVGDIHQPLHAVTMYSKDFPNGDRGGNSFKLKKTGQVDELHALWDSVVTEFETDWTQPLDESEWANLSDAAQTISSKYPRSDLELNMTVENWAQESLTVAEASVYKGATQGGWPNQDYIAAGKIAAEKRLAQGGYRLADLIVAIYNQGGFEVTE